MMNYRIRSLQLVDIKKVVEIEKSSFLNPWDSDIFTAFATRGGSFTVEDETLTMMVFEKSGQVVGYVVWSESRGKNESRIMNLAVEVSFRRKGIGRILLEHVFNKLRNHGVRTCFLEARESNVAAHELYKSIGMEVVGKRTAYYGNEDAVLFSIDF
ncbi:MAG: ribosomal protein S18-alanine N-acetyltransferase [Candidatus Thorarchaeota archaeon]|jgi:ribosomal-protein-alanine N-acetyltransferase